MTAIHMQATGIDGESARISVESALKRLRGVARVAIVRSAGLVSVLFDERRANVNQLLGAIRALGVEAHLYRR